MHVHVLMATRDGAAHLAEQLDSIAAQSHRDWSLRAQDDGSRDGTRAILDRFAAAQPGRVEVLPGPGRGSAGNFLSLLGRPGRDGRAAVAFADQDDVWLPGHLARALEALGDDPRPATYACPTLLSDESLRILGPSRPPDRPPAFANALVQNVLAGNTLVLNPAGAALLAATVPAALAEGVPFHDWWAYLVATGAGARVVVGEEAGLIYRQHRGNLMGAHRGPLAGLARLGAVLAGRHGAWIGRNLAALDAVAPLLTPEARSQARALARARALRGPLARVRALDATGVWRQTPAQQAALRASAALGRL